MSAAGSVGVPSGSLGTPKFSDLWDQDFCAVQYPEQPAVPERPFHVPWPAVFVSLPDPAAYLSCTVTDACTRPFAPTLPVNLTRLGWLTIPLAILTSKL